MLPVSVSESSLKIDQYTLHAESLPSPLFGKLRRVPDFEQVPKPLTVQSYEAFQAMINRRCGRGWPHWPSSSGVALARTSSVYAKRLRRREDVILAAYLPTFHYIERIEIEEIEIEELELYLSPTHKPNHPVPHPMKSHIK